MSGIVVVVAFLVCLLVITGIGVLASLVQHQKSTEDYLVAGRRMPAWLTALSAVATNNSGFMFIGLIGYTYLQGIEAIWMMLGWVTGDLLAWLYVHPRLRQQSGEVRANTIPMLIGTHGTRINRSLMILGGVITFLFLGVYAAAQLKAGSAALQTLFGWDLRVGALIGTLIVIVYCYAGGIRASIWTDVAQSLVMIVSMLILLIFAALEIGGPSALWWNLAEQDPDLVKWFPASLKFGFPLYLLGMVAGGFGAIGQPHILVRFMAIDSLESIRRARSVYFAWFIPFFLLAIATGLYARACLPDLALLDLTKDLSTEQAAEFALPVLARTLLPDLLLGFMLAGLFSATMSTADSQILVCSGSLTQDIFPQWRESYLASKAATLLVALLAFVIAISADESVFALVLVAWSSMGATLGPLLVLRLYNRPPSTILAICMMLSGLTTVLAWHYLGYDGDVFKMLPGFLAPLLLYLATLAYAFIRKRRNETEK